MAWHYAFFRAQYDDDSQSGAPWRAIVGAAAGADGQVAARALASRSQGLNRESNRCWMDVASTCPPPYEIVAHDHSHFFTRRRLTCGAPFACRGPSCRFKGRPRHTQQRIRDVRATASHRIDPGVAVVLSASGRVRTSTTAGLPENNGKRRQAGSQHVCGSQLHRRGNDRPRQEFHPGVGQRLINPGTDPASTAVSGLRRIHSGQ